MVDAVKKLSPAVAVEKLQLLSRSAAEPIRKTLQSAMSNATQSKKVAIESLKIKNILVDEGAKMRRRDKSHRPGKEGIIQKRTSHIKVILED